MLGLAWNNLKDEGACAFAESIQTGEPGHLKKLDMGNNSIGDSGVRKNQTTYLNSVRISVLKPMKRSRQNGCRLTSLAGLHPSFFSFMRSNTLTKLSCDSVVYRPAL